MRQLHGQEILGQKLTLVCSNEKCGFKKLPKGRSQKRKPGTTNKRNSGQLKADRARRIKETVDSGNIRPGTTNKRKQGRRINQTGYDG